MVTKLHKKTSTPKDDSEPMTGSVKDSAQQIWQAGLGAFAKAQAEGTRAFEALVKDGTTLQRKTQAAAEDRISDATHRMTHMATDISSKASGHWDKLENIFEERVAKALNKLGVPSAKDVNALIARIDDLKSSVQKLSGEKPASTTKVPARGTAKAPARGTAKAPARRKPKAAATAVAPPTPVKAKSVSAKRAIKPAAKAVKTTRRPAAKRKPASTSAAS